MDKTQEKETHHCIILFLPFYAPPLFFSVTQSESSPTLFSLDPRVYNPHHYICKKVFVLCVLTAEQEQIMRLSRLSPAPWIALVTRKLHVVMSKVDTTRGNI